jgi:hypothetical protein
MELPQDPEAHFKQLADGRDYNDIFARHAPSLTMSTQSDTKGEEQYEVGFGVTPGDISSFNDQRLVLPISRAQFGDDFFLVGVGLDRVLCNCGVYMRADICKIDQNGSEISLIGHHSRLSVTRPVTPGRAMSECCKEFEGLVYIPPVVPNETALGGSIHAPKVQGKIKEIESGTPTLSLFREFLESSYVARAAGNDLVIKEMKNADDVARFASILALLKSPQFRSLNTALSASTPTKTKSLLAKEGAKTHALTRGGELIISDALWTASIVLTMRYLNLKHVIFRKSDNMALVLTPVFEDERIPADYGLTGCVVLRISKTAAP